MWKKINDKCNQTERTSKMIGIDLFQPLDFLLVNVPEFFFFFFHNTNVWVCCNQNASQNFKRTWLTLYIIFKCSKCHYIEYTFGIQFFKKFIFNFFKEFFFNLENSTWYWSDYINICHFFRIIYYKKNV